jgi:hypothetical protein
MDTAFPGRCDRRVRPPAIRKAAKKDLTASIQTMLIQFRFVSCSVICKKLEINKVIYIHIFYEGINLNKFYHKLVPHFLDKSQKCEYEVFSEQFCMS